MQKLRGGIEFILSSSKWASLLLIIIALLLISSIFLKNGNKASAQEAIAKPNLTVTQVQLRRNAYPNANCSNGTLVTEGMMLNPGETIEVCMVYSNNGTAVSSSNFKIDNYINQTTQPAAGTRGYQSYPYPLGSLGPGGSYTLEIGSIVPSTSICSSNCHAGVFIDSDNTVSESNESDNFAYSVSYSLPAVTTSFCVSCAAPPDGCSYTGGSCQSCGTVVCTTSTPAPTCTPRPACSLPGANPICGLVELTGGGTYCPLTTLAPTTVGGNGAQCSVSLAQGASQHGSCQSAYICQINAASACTDSMPGSCTGTCVVTTTPPICPLHNSGDANCDGKIDIEDFNVWKADFLSTFGSGNNPGDSLGLADFNNDNKVDTDDFNIWRDGFIIKSAKTGSCSAVPDANGVCPAGCVNYGNPLGCVTQQYYDECQTQGGCPK